ncbi:MAG: peroxiredoxin family protein [Actinomycetota bacterium]|nr:peroxiredoxin family protein [Actinomycetota bacterium]
MSLLQNGQSFPALDIPAVGGGTISLPEDLAGSFGVVLIYRGSWCPYCNAQLASFSRAQDRLTEVGIKVVALSVDDEATSAALVDKHHLSFPVGHSADADKVAAVTGAYTNETPHHLQSTGFVLAPDGSVMTAVYSSGAIGRLVPEDVAGLVEYVNSQT